MKKIVLILSIIAITLSSFSQDSTKRYVDHGLLRLQGNIGLGKPLTMKGTNIYWVGDLDYYCRNNISISSGVYYFINSYGGDKVFKQNHMAYLGASYHFKTNGKLDPYIGILPGYSINKLNSSSIAFADTSKAISSYPFSINPVFAVQAGVVFYANRFFNVFANVKYQKGKHFSDIAAVPLDELKISFGLGYMIWAKKHYVSFRKPNDDSQ